MRNLEKTTRPSARARNHLRTRTFGWIIGFTIALSLSSNAAAKGRVLLLHYDRNGAVLTDSDSRQPVLHQDDRLILEFHPSQLFDLSHTDLPPLGQYQQGTPAFVFPEDPSILSSGTNLPPIASIHPGITSVYVMGNGHYKLRMTRLSKSEFEKEVPTSPQKWKEQIPGEKPPAYLSTEVSGGGFRLAEGGATAALRERVGIDHPSRAPRLYVLPDVRLPAIEQQPYAKLELLQVNENAAKDEILKDYTPSDALKAAMSGDATQLTVAITRAATFVVVAKDFESVSLRYKFDIAPGSESLQMQETAPGSGVFRQELPKLEGAKLSYQFCYQVTSATSNLTVGTEHCVPLTPATLSILEPLPGSTRLQPGIMTSDRCREVQFTVHMVFIVDRRSYFREYKPKLWGGYLNPAVGLQLGGSESTVVLLLGGHIRLIEEAGVVVGARFGDQPSSTPYRIDRNLYFGFSLDPALFTSLRQSK